MMTPVLLTDLTPEEMAHALAIKPYQGRQLFRWLHKKRVFDFERMTDLSKELRESLRRRCRVPQLELVEVLRSRQSPGTKKALFRLHDGECVESVLIRDGNRRTICLSTQVGCAIQCAFCATGLEGFTRNLSAGEIVEQALMLLVDEDLQDRTPNIVYMGMGEPFRNYEATVRSIRLLMAREGVGAGARKITVSTVGDVAGIRRFAREPWQVRLSVSLHAANNALRSRLVPLNKHYPLETLLAAVKDYIAETGRQVTFEWTLMDGVNDSRSDAEELAKLAGQLRVVINLIPFNFVSGLPATLPGRGSIQLAPPSTKRCEAFRDALLAENVKCTLRKERGQDIAAACGQLRAHNSSGQRGRVDPGQPGEIGRGAQ